MSNIDVILSQLGWQDGFRIPVANEDNKRLEEEVMTIIIVSHIRSCSCSINSYSSNCFLLSKERLISVQIIFQEIPYN